MTWYEHVIAAIQTVTDQVSHGGRMKSTRYFVWQEDGRNDFEADNVHTEKAWTGSTDLFSKIELDPWADQYETAMDADDCLVWSLSSCDFDPDTGFWHWVWDWEAVGDGQSDSQRG